MLEERGGNTSSIQKIILAMPLIVQPFQPVVSPSPGAIAGWMSGTNPSLPHAAVAAGSPGLMQPSSAGKGVWNVF